MLGLLGAWVAAAGPNDNQQPQGHAYVRIPFGGSSRTVKEPFHYGLRFDYSANQGPSDGRELPAIAQFDFDNRGNRLALVGGVPFAGRIQPPLRQNEGDASAPAGGAGSGGFTFFDWGLLAVGVGGVGYAIYEVSKSKDSPDPPAPPPGAATSSGGAANGLATAATGLVDAAASALTAAVPGLPTASTGYTGNRTVDGALPFDPVDNRDQAYQKWLDGGTGHMGDLKPQH